MKEDKKHSSWDFDKDELLIEWVKNKRELYDLRCPRYNDNAFKRNTWFEIGTQLMQDGSDCKKRWESLRAQHRKTLNKQLTRSSRGAICCKWKYEDQMAFLKEFMKDGNRTSVTGEEDSDTEESDEIVKHEEVIDGDTVILKQEESEVIDSELLPTQSLLCKRRKSMSMEGVSKECTLQNAVRYIAQNKNEESTTPHPIDTFFSLMAQSVKNFNPADQHVIKTKVFALVSEIEEKYILQDQHLSVCQHSSQTTPFWD